jgi:hypothetical protein
MTTAGFFNSINHNGRQGEIAYADRVTAIAARP